MQTCNINTSISSSSCSQRRTQKQIKKTKKMGPPPHIVFFPFMSKGHTIPVFHLARLLLARGVTVTIITTPRNSPSIRQSLANTDTKVLVLPFPQDIPGLPNGIESTDKLPSMSLILPFVNATKLMQPDLEQALRNLQPLTCLISDGFLGWTHYAASKLGVPRYVFYGMGSFSMTMSNVLLRDRPHANIESDDMPFVLPDFPWLKFTKNDFNRFYSESRPEGPLYDFVMEQERLAKQSEGYIANSFYELENKFVDYWNKNSQNPPQICVGPLCLAEPPKEKPMVKPMWIQWLDEKLANGKSVLYVAFGTQAEISEEQLEEIVVGLERAEVNFLWVVRSIGSQQLDRFNEMMEGRGLVMNEWVDQVEILRHESVNGFMSHCGWNSVLESICASVPIVAFPMMAEQHLNAKFVAEEIGVGVKVLARNGSVWGFVGSECIEKMVKELMEGEKGKEARKKVKEIGEMARKSMKQGGSSWHALDKLIGGKPAQLHQ